MATVTRFSSCALPTVGTTVDEAVSWYLDKLGSVF